MHRIADGDGDTALAHLLRAAQFHRGVRWQQIGDLAGEHIFARQFPQPGLEDLSRRGQWNLFQRIERLGDRCRFGNMRARFEGKSSALVATHVVTLIISGVIVVAAIGAVFFAGGAAAMSGAGQEGAAAAASGVAFIAFLLAGVLIMLTRSFYHAALMREKMRGLTLGSIRFKCTATGLDVLKLRLGNLLLVVFTLGLAMPVVIHRRMKFSAQHLIVGGDLDSAELMQAAREKGAVGEGLDDLFGIDTDIGLG